MAEPSIHTASRLVFEQGVEGLFVKAMKDKMTPELKAKLKAAGLDLDKKLQPAYPLDEWNRWVTVLGEALYPDLEPDKQKRKIGELLVDGYFNTFVGKALEGVLKIIGPKRALLRTRQNFRSANNYTEVKYTELGPTSVDVWMNETEGSRHATAGTIEAGMRYAGAKELSVTIVAADADGTTYRVSWT